MLWPLYYKFTNPPAHLRLSVLVFVPSMVIMPMLTGKFSCAKSDASERPIDAYDP